jgi:hypothetical protein
VTYLPTYPVTFADFVSKSDRMDVLISVSGASMSARHAVCCDASCELCYRTKRTFFGLLQVHLNSMWRGVHLGLGVYRKNPEKWPHGVREAAAGIHVTQN